MSATDSTAARPAAPTTTPQAPAPFESASEGLARRIWWGAHDALVLTQRNLRITTRIPELLVASMIQPVVFVLLFRYVFGGAIHVGAGASYANYLMAGIFVQTVAFGGVTTGIGLAHDLEDGLIDRFRSLPMSGSAVLLGRAIADLLRNVFAVLVTLLVGLAVGFRPQGSASGWLAALGLLLLLSFSFSWLGACVGLAVRNVEAVQSASVVWLLPLVFASSAFVPTATMPGWLRSFAEAQPISKAVDAVRAWVLDRPAGSTGWIALAWCVGAMIVLMPVAMALFRRAAAKP
jgi:ABC-2 type transport system permease protein/oleandomycin transport system permease protein